MKIHVITLFLLLSGAVNSQDKDLTDLKNTVSSNIAVEDKEDALWSLLDEVSWTEPNYSMTLIDSLLQISSIHSDSVKYMNVVRYQGKTQRAVGNYANSLNKYQEHYDYHLRIQDSLNMALSSGQIGLLNLFSGNMNIAQEYLLKSHELYSIKGTPADIAGANNGLASFYLDMGQNEKALKRYGMALEAYTSAYDTMGMANVHANTALVLIERKEYAEAERNLRLQGKYDSILGTNWGLGFYHDFMGYLYSEQNRYEEAYESYLVALKIREGEQSHYNIDESRTSLANILLQMDRHGEAIEQAERIFDNKEEQQSLSHQQSAYNILTIAYEKIGNYKKAFQNQRQYKIISDSIYNRDHLAEIAENDAKYNKAEQDTKIAVLNAEKVLSEKLISQKNRTIGIGGVSLALISLLSFLLYRVLRKVNQSKVELSAAVRDKDLLIKEIHHRVKNNLQLVSSLLSMQSRTIDDPSVSSAIEDGKARVRSMALIHQDLYQNNNLKGVSVKSYLDDLCKELFNTYNVDESKVSLDIDIENIVLDIDTIVPLGLILNELITNSLKYAFPGNQEGTIYISLHASEKALLLKVQDDGVGYDVNHTTKRSSFGTKLIKALSRQLEGEVSVDTSSGTKIEITIKKYELA